MTGNIVLAAVVAVDGGSFHWAQLLTIPVFMLALATVWLIAQASGRHGSRLARLLLRVQFLVLAALLIFSVITRPSANPAGLRAGAAAMMAVSAMACQYALLRPGRDIDGGDDRQFSQCRLVSDGLALGTPPSAAA